MGNEGRRLRAGDEGRRWPQHHIRGRRTSQAPEILISQCPPQLRWMKVGRVCPWRPQLARQKSILVLFDVHEWGVVRWKSSWTVGCLQMAFAALTPCSHFSLFILSLQIKVRCYLKIYIIFKEKEEGKVLNDLFQSMNRFLSTTKNRIINIILLNKIEMWKSALYLQKNQNTK